MKWKVKEDRHWFKKGQILDDTDYKPQWDSFLEPIFDEVPKEEPIVEEKFDEADVNKDGKVDVSDAVEVVKGIFGKRKKKKKAKRGKK